jgi:hypothetical protein
MIRSLGVPHLPAGFGGRYRQHLKSAEIRSLMFGQTIEGVNLKDATVIRRTIDVNGTSSFFPS